MALPPGIQAKTVTLGIASFADGSLATGRATISMPVNVIHTPTNRPIFSSEITKPFVDGEVSFDLLPTDAPGLNRVDWAFKLRVEIAGATTQPEVLYFLLPTAGPDVVDLDGLVTVPSSAGVPIAVDVLTVDEFGPSISAAIADSTSATSAALRSTFGTQLVNPQALRKFWVALGQRQSNPVRIAVTGNSKREGTGATNYIDRFPLALQERLRRSLQPAAVLGAPVPNVHLAAMTPVPAGAPYTVTGNAAGSSFGLGGRGFKLLADGTTTVTVPFTGDRVIAHYIRAAAGAKISFALDGGAATVLDTFLSGVPQQHGQYDSGPLTRGAHTLVMTRDATSTAGREGYLGDIEIFDGDYAKGIRVFDHSRHGVTAAGFIAAQTGWTNEFTALAPWALLIMGFGENDGARTPAQYRADVESVIAYHRTQGFAGSILLVHDAKPSGIATDAAWAALGDAERQIALADPLVAWLDMSNAIPAYEATNAFGVYADTTHATSGGQGWAADLVATALLPRP